MTKTILWATLFCLAFGAMPARAQEIIRYSSAEPGSSPVETEAVLSLPPNAASPSGKFPAVVLLHSGGGWQWPVTAQYARALTAAGFATGDVTQIANPAPAGQVIQRLDTRCRDGLHSLLQLGLYRAQI